MYVKFHWQSSSSVIFVESQNILSRRFSEMLKCVLCRAKLKFLLECDLQILVNLYLICLTILFFDTANNVVVKLKTQIIKSWAIYVNLRKYYLGYRLQISLQLYCF